MRAISETNGQRASSNAQLPWDEMASAEVRGIKGAITAQLGEQKVPDEVAPMMAELLARLDSFVEGSPQLRVAAPEFMGPGEPPTTREAALALSRAADRLREYLRAEHDTAARARLERMERVLTAHLSLRHEVAMRAQI